MKHWIKTILLRWWSSVRPNYCGKVIFYHDIGKHYTRMGTPQDLFKEHVATACANGYRYVEQVEELRGDNGHKALMLCFDDGFRGIWDEREYFMAEGLRPTVFVAVELIGKTGYLTWDEILELQSQYGFIFESHTWSHQTLAGSYIDESPQHERTDEWFRRELYDSKIAIGERLGKEITGLCFPAGHFSDDVIDRCRLAGYRNMFASYPGIMTDDDIVPRHLVQAASVKDFMCVLRGGYIPLRKYYIRQHRTLAR